MSEPIILDRDERRVLGVLIEKSLTTPQGYPLSINAVVTGSNQKSNRDPLVEYVEDEAEEILQRLRERGYVSVVFPAGGRVEKYRQTFTSELDLEGRQMAVIGELLLRGAQTLGDLRGRANRMKAIADLSALDEVFRSLAEHDPPLVRRLSPEGQKRGVRVSHNFHSESELSQVLEVEEELGVSAAVASRAPRPASTASAASAPPAPALQALVAQIEALEQRVAALEQQLR